MTSSDRQLLERAAREAFEADYFGTFSDCPAIERDGDGYKAAHVQSAWGIWQAAWTASRQKALQEAEKLRAALINIEEACVYSPHREIGTWDASLAQLIHHHVQFLQAASAIRSLGGITSNEGDKRHADQHR